MGQFKVWCPVCDEHAFLDHEGDAKGLAQIHDENYHDGQRQTYVLRSLTASTND